MRTVKTNQEREASIIAKAARLIYFGLENRSGITTNREFKELISEYKTNSEFRSITDAIANGLKLSILDIDSSGVFLKPQYESIFTIKKAYVRNILKKGDEKYIGLILIALASYYYPTAAKFEEESVDVTRPIFVNRLDALISEKIQFLKEQNKSKHAKSTEIELEKLLVSYEQLPNESKIGSRQSSTREFYIRKTLNFLTDQRLFIKKSSNEFWPTKKFRLQMQDLAESNLLERFMQNTNSGGK